VQRLETAGVSGWESGGECTGGIPGAAAAAEDPVKEAALAMSSLEAAMRATAEPRIGGGLRNKKWWTMKVVGANQTRERCWKWNEQHTNGGDGTLRHDDPGEESGLKRLHVHVGLVRFNDHHNIAGLDAVDF
jgi:hypothetical protein